MFSIHANDKKNYINVFQVLLEVLEANNMKLGSRYSRSLVGVVWMLYCLCLFHPQNDVTMKGCVNGTNQLIFKTRVPEKEQN